MKTTRYIAFCCFLFPCSLLLALSPANNCSLETRYPASLLPEITCPNNITLFAPGLTCTVPFNYTIEYSGGDLTQTTGLPSGEFPVGQTVNTFVVTDSVGNTSSCSFTVTVRDNTPPVMLCTEQAVVSIGLDDPQDCYGNNSASGGIAWVNASSFDLGSADNCSNIHLTIRRVAPYSSCVLGLNPVNGHPNCDDLFPDFPSEFERAISEYDSIKFYCCEAGSTQTIALRAYQLNADGNFSIGQNGLPIFNECLVSVRVEDNIKPVCIPPQNVTVSCEQFDPTLAQYGFPNKVDNCCIDTITSIVDFAQFDTLCSRGTITRSFMATDCSGNSSSCSQRIVATYAQDYFIRFPDDVVVTNCSPGGNFGVPTIIGNGCELLGTAYEDEIFLIISDACYRIDRQWRVINWCTFNPALPLINVPNPNPSAVVNHPSNLPGPTVSPCGTAAPWAPTVVKITPTDTAETDYCTFWDANANGYRYRQVIKILDTEEGPVVATCPVTTPLFIDSTLNDPALWHNVFKPNAPSVDLTETAVELSISSSDACSGPSINYECQLFFDLDQDGVLETVANSPDWGGHSGGLGWNNILYGNLSGAGIPTTFDNRAVPADQKWGFALQETIVGSNKLASVKFNTMQSPSTFVAPVFPEGKHRIKWYVADGCGNETVCEYAFTVQQGQLSSGLGALPANGFALLQNQPNPFGENTSISFVLPEPAAAALSVYNLQGALIFSQNGNYEAGLHTVLLPGKSLQPGVLFYKLESEGKIAWRKMLLQR